MGERRSNRGPKPRTDRQVSAHVEDVFLLGELDAGRVTVTAETRVDLRRLAREDLCLAGFGLGTRATLLPRGQLIVAAARGETWNQTQLDGRLPITLRTADTVGEILRHVPADAHPQARYGFYM